MKTCPQCRSRIDPRAIKCPNCGTAFDAMTMEAGRKEHARDVLGWAFLGAVALIGAVYFITSDDTMQRAIDGSVTARRAP